jgi:septum site-determining protein MinC
MATDLEQNNAVVADMAFQLKGGMFTLTTLHIINNDVAQLKAQLSEKIKQAPNFFSNAPVVLDLKPTMQHDLNIDFAALHLALKELHLVPVGIKNASPEQISAATAQGFAILRDSTMPKEAPKNTPAPQITPKSSSKIITTPVRSGQQIYAPEGDLIIINQVSPGSELIADGSIHVYGPLRGRAIAGINGNRNARIFCQSLEAELVSVAGDYKLSEDIERQAWKIAAQIYLKNDRLQITSL